MKKNVFLKLASALLVLCLASTCAIGTTFAKYTTGDSASDTARVAKWGITVSTSGTLFGKYYASNSAGTDKDSIVASSTNVASMDASKIVAPGTKNTTGFQVAISGTPEVQYNVTAATTGTIEDIFLAAGTYGVMVEVLGLNAASDVSALYTTDGTTYTLATTGVWDSSKTYYALHDKVTLADAYYPITWTVSNSGSAPAVATTKDLNAVAAAIAAGLNNDAVDGNANEDSVATYKLTWEWPWEANNGADTILGNIAAGVEVVKLDSTNYTKTLDNGTDYNLEIVFGLTVTVDQVN